MKIQDRVLLGVIAGFLGTFSKNVTVKFAKNRGWAELNGTETAAGILLPGFKISTTEGKVVGHIVNHIIGSILGVGLTYLYSVTGKDKAAFKGIAFSVFAWGLLYGSIATLGGSSVRPVLSKTLISNLMGHIAYGITASSLITHLGDRGLFDGTIPLTIQKSEEKSDHIEQDFIEQRGDSNEHGEETPTNGEREEMLTNMARN